MSEGTLKARLLSTSSIRISSTTTLRPRSTHKQQNKVEMRRCIKAKDKRTRGEFKKKLVKSVVNAVKMDASLWSKGAATVE